MRRPLLSAFLVLAAVALLLQPGRAVADAPPTEGHLTIVLYSADVTHLGDHKTLSVREFYFYNNTGTERFSGNITMWLQDGASITTPQCGAQGNNVLREESGVTQTCISMNPIDTETFKFNPFNGSEFLSYFGEKQIVFLNASTQNATAKLGFNVTVGAGMRFAARQSTLGNVTMSSPSVELGIMAPPTDRFPPHNLTLSQLVNLTNSGGDREGVSLRPEGVPLGWSASMVLRSGTPVTSVQVPPGGYTNVFLNITVPSYILEIYMEYVLTGSDLSSGEASVTLRKLFPYNTSHVEIVTYTFDRDEMSLDGDFAVWNPGAPHSFPQWDEATQRYWSLVVGPDNRKIAAGTISSISLKWTPPPFVIPLWVIAAIVLFLFGLIAFPIYRRKSKESREESAEETTKPEEERKPAVSLPELRERREVLKKSLERLDSDEKEGVTPKDILASMKQELQTELVDVERQIGILSTATAKKKAILKALRNLERDHKDGKVDDEVYSSLKARYEKEAVSILKQIDEARGAGQSKGETDE